MSAFAARGELPKRDPAAADTAQKPIDFRFVAESETAITAAVEAHLRRQWKRYENLLPPRISAPATARVPEVRLYRTLESYRQALASRGLTVENPAVFLRDDGVVLLGFDGGRFEAALQSAAERVEQRKAAAGQLARAFAEQQKADAKRFERENTPPGVRNELRGRRMREFQKSLAAAEDAADEAEAANRRTFAEATDRLLTVAAHELFHAYVAVRLYPPDDDRLPAWLHEGLAQLVEHGRWRGERLIVDSPPPDFVRLWKEAFEPTAPMPKLRDLLNSDDAGFLAHDRQASTEVRKTYLVAWSLVQYLACAGAPAKREALDAYATGEGSDAEARFERFAGNEAAAVEAGWHAWLRKWVK